MNELMDENGVFTEEFKEQLPVLLENDYYNDPETKQEPTKMFDNIKDFKSLTKMAATAQRKATQNEAKYAEKYKGMVKVPDDKATKEEIAAYRKAVGVPDKPETYELQIPDDDDKAGFEVIAGVVRTAAHEGGVPNKVLSGIWGKVVTALQAQNKALEDKGLELMQADEKTLKDKYKEKYPAFIKTGDETLSKFKVGKAVSDLLTTYGILNHPAIRELLGTEIAPLVLEGHTVGGVNAGEPAGDGWPLTYKYDPISGKPI